MGVVAAFAVLMSGLPRVFAWPLAVLALMQGVRLARHESRRQRIAVLIPGGDAAATVNGVAVSDLRFHWRGVCAVLAWRDADRRWHRRLWMPSQLPVAARRELRLAVGDFHAARGQRSMAP